MIEQIRSRGGIKLGYRLRIESMRAEVERLLPIVETKCANAQGHAEHLIEQWVLYNDKCQCENMTFTFA